MKEDIENKVVHYDDGQVMCKHCGGYGEIPIDQVVLFKHCEFCHGEGKIDWVTYVLDQPMPGCASDDLFYKINHRNIQNLLVKLQEYCNIMGYQFRYDLVQRDPRYEIFPSIGGLKP